MVDQWVTKLVNICDFLKGELISIVHLKSILALTASDLGKWLGLLCKAQEFMLPCMHDIKGQNKITLFFDQSRTIVDRQGERRVDMFWDLGSCAGSSYDQRTTIASL